MRHIKYVLIDNIFEIKELFEHIITIYPYMAFATVMSICFVVLNKKMLLSYIRGQQTDLSAKSF